MSMEDAQETETQDVPGILDLRSHMGLLAGRYMRQARARLPTQQEGCCRLIPQAFC